MRENISRRARRAKLTATAVRPRREPRPVQSAKREDHRQAARHVREGHRQEGRFIARSPSVATSANATAGPFQDLQLSAGVATITRDLLVVLKIPLAFDITLMLH